MSETAIVNNESSKEEWVVEELEDGSWRYSFRHTSEKLQLLERELWAPEKDTYAIDSESFRSFAETHQDVEVVVRRQTHHYEDSSGSPRSSASFWLDLMGWKDLVSEEEVSWFHSLHAAQKIK